MSNNQCTLGNRRTLACSLQWKSVKTRLIYREEQSRESAASWEKTDIHLVIEVISTINSNASHPWEEKWMKWHTRSLPLSSCDYKELLCWCTRAISVWKHRVGSRSCTGQTYKGCSAVRRRKDLSLRSALSFPSGQTGHLEDIFYLDLAVEIVSCCGWLSDTLHMDKKRWLAASLGICCWL